MAAGAPAGRLAEIARTAVGDPGAVVGTWAAAAPRGASGGSGAASSVCVLAGAVRVGAEERPWSVVLKVVARAAGQDDPAGINYWRREALLYGSGLLDDQPGLRAPRCYGCDEQADGSVWLWLEHVREDGDRAWPIERWALAGRHLGQLNGAYAAGRPLPEASWLGGRRLRSLLDRHVELVARIAAAPDDPRVRHWWPRDVVDGILRLWAERERFLNALEQLPQAFCHGDAIRRNLIARRRADGAEETVAVDWEHAGRYALGEEVGQTLSVATAFFDLDPADLPALDEALFAAYLAGLAGAGWRGDPGRVRFAYAAHAALRNLFNAVGATVPDEARRASTVERYGHTGEELAGRRAEIRPFLLERAEEARRLLSAV